MNKKDKKVLALDLEKIFLTPPNTKKEKIFCVVLMLMFFVMFFAPICFSNIHPIKAILISSAPALSFTWGLMVLTRYLYRKEFFAREQHTI